MNGLAITALLIDDHAVVLQGYRTLLEQAGIEVLATARSAGEGLKAFGELRPRVTVTDLALPDMHGLEIIRSIRQLDTAAGILVFSMHDDVVLASCALQAGATAYVTKTSPSPLLVEAVRRVTAGERYLSPDIAPSSRSIARTDSAGRSTSSHRANSNVSDCWPKATGPRTWSPA